MADLVVPGDYEQLTTLMRAVANEALVLAPELRLLFVTNLREGDVVDLGPDGVANIAQYYSRRQADEIIRSLQDLGLTVEASFSETKFLESLLGYEPSDDDRQRIVYSTAEGGRGAGRRALIPAMCNLLSVPALNSGAHASSMVRHKFHAYAVLRRVGVRVPETWQYADGNWVAGLAPAAGARVIVKPIYESMGIGVGEDSVKVVDRDFDAFVQDKQHSFGQPAIVQEFISGEEVGVPVARIGSTYALPPVAQRRADGEPYDRLPKTFRDEHVDGNISLVNYEAPAAQILAMRDAAVLAFDSLDMKGAGRIDFRVDSDGRAWAFDTNGEPPPLANTSWAFSMQRLGFSFQELLAVWLGICLLDHGLISGVRPE